MRVQASFVSSCAYSPLGRLDEAQVLLQAARSGYATMDGPEPEGLERARTGLRRLDAMRDEAKR